MFAKVSAISHLCHQLCHLLLFWIPINVKEIHPSSKRFLVVILKNPRYLPEASLAATNTFTPYSPAFIPQPQFNPVQYTTSYPAFRFTSTTYSEPPSSFSRRLSSTPRYTSIPRPIISTPLYHRYNTYSSYH